MCSVPKVEPRLDAAPMVLVIDEVRDPGEMGSLLRMASVVGCHFVVVMQGSRPRMKSYS